MTVRTIPSIGDPLLRVCADEVDPADIGSPAVQRVIDDLVDTMRAANGAGLAANQIGEAIRIVVLEVNDKITAAASGQHDSEYGDSYFVVQPRFETGDIRYAWLNRCVGLAEGRVGRNKVWYRAFRAIHG